MLARLGRLPVHLVETFIVEAPCVCHPKLLEYAREKKFMDVICRVLIVDDYEPWRCHVRRALQASQDWQIVGEAADGPEAIEMAEDLEPDLILLDVGLPTLSGIEVAKRILAAKPTQRILFISEHRSLAGGALAAGARGYIIKSDAGLELLPAMEAIRDGRRYVGAGAAPPRLDIDLEHVHRHDAGFYADEASMLNAWIQAAESALKAGHTFILISIESRERTVRNRLQSRGVDIDRAIQEKRCVFVNPSDMLSQFMVDDWPDEALFEKAATPVLVDALNASTSTRPRVMVCGDCVSGLWRDGKGDATVRIEQLWDALTRAHEVDTLCGYLMDPPPHDDHRQVFQRICAEHTAVYSAG
jgi:DNA-binding NarL/FixJ family response regulator